jgi:hypothetical protein
MDKLHKSSNTNYKSLVWNIEARNHLEDLAVDRTKVLELAKHNVVEGCGLDLSGWEYGWRPSFCELANETWVSIHSKAVNVLISRVTGSFSKTTLLRGLLVCYLVMCGLNWTVAYPYFSHIFKRPISHGILNICWNTFYISKSIYKSSEIWQLQTAATGDWLIPRVLTHAVTAAEVT